MRRLATLLLVTSIACSPGSDRVELLVFAASSLTDAFGAIEERFELTHRNVDVIVNFGPSDGLAAQIRSEGSADVFASASDRWMDDVAADPGVLGRVDFARNSMIVVTPASDSGAVSSLADLAVPGVQVVLAVEGVPVGDYAREVLANAGILEAVTANVVSNEEDAAGVLAKIAAGEADAAIVYASDVATEAGRGLRAIAIEADLNVEATYPIAVVVGSTEVGVATEFLDAVVGAEGRRILRAHGFEPAG